MPSSPEGAKAKPPTSSAMPGSAREQVTIPVSGMTCAACQSFIQRTLASQAGVQDATVNLMLHNATVTFDPGATSTSALVDTIRHAGYGAEVPVESRRCWWSRKSMTKNSCASTNNSA